MATLFAISRSSAQESATDASAKPATKTFRVSHYDVYGNTVLSQAQIEGVLSHHTGEELGIEDLKKGLGELQLLYRNYGYPSIYVSLPPQKITNGVVRVDVVEGKLSNIKVEGNKWFSVHNVLRTLPGLNTNVLLNAKWFQTELDLANGNADRQIYPVIEPGAEPETTELTLRVKDRFPLHWHAEVNNKSTPNTPTLRVDTAVQYNNLWQLEHQIGVQYNFSPERMKSEEYLPNIFDQPKVASYSGFYRIPLGFFASGLRETYERQPADFGYDPVARKFNLPAATGKPELIIYASRSVSETPVFSGPVTIVSSSTNLDTFSQFTERDLTFNQNVGSKLTIPAKSFAGVRSSFTLGVDFKTYQAQTFSTNTYYADYYSTDPNTGGRGPIITSIIIPPFGTFSENNLAYLPISFGWSASRPDKWGSTTFSINQNLFLEPLASDRKDFQAVAGSTAAGGNTTTINATAAREQKLPRDWAVLLRANGQWASAPLIGNEQFGIGGTAGVRGYSEGSEYGDSGWRVLCDLRAPPWQIGSFPSEDGNDLPAFLRCSIFMDGGEVYRLSRPGLANPTAQQWGTGFGLFFSAGEHLDARFSLGWALLDTPNTKAGSASAYLSLGVQY